MCVCVCVCLCVVCVCECTEKKEKEEEKTEDSKSVVSNSSTTFFLEKDLFIEYIFINCKIFKLFNIMTSTSSGILSRYSFWCVCVSFVLTLIN